MSLIKKDSDFVSIYNRPKSQNQNRKLPLVENKNKASPEAIKNSARIAELLFHLLSCGIKSHSFIFRLTSTLLINFLLFK